MSVSRSRVAGGVIAAVAVVSATVVTSTPVGASTEGNTEACTPGYWKNHTDNWLENPQLVIPTTKKLGSVFSALGATHPSLADDTFLDALSYKGGSGTEGSARLLLHHAVAAYLNAAYDDDDGHMRYPLRREFPTSFYPAFGGIIPEVNAALESGDRGTMLALKDFFDGIANDLICPL